MLEVRVRVRANVIGLGLGFEAAVFPVAGMRLTIFSAWYGEG